MAEKKNIILGVTASIAIYKACDITRKLTAEGFSVNLVMTEESVELIRPIVFQSLSGNKVYYKMFEPSETWEIEHISLASKANLVLVAPATANIIAKVACGISDDLLTCVISAAKAPVLFAPAMNENMYKNKITQGNIKKLEALEYKFIGPRCGRLACGKTGLGCLSEVDEIIRAVKTILK